MKYAVIIYQGQDAFEMRDSQEARDMFAAYQAYSDALVAAGVLTGGAALQAPGTATTVRISDGKRLVQDGPFADTKEQLAGLFLIDVPSLDAALEWARAARPRAARRRVARSWRSAGADGAGPDGRVRSGGRRRRTVRPSLAFLAARAGDVTAAEDAWATPSAPRSALPLDGVPPREAWLLTAARRRLIDAARHLRVRADAATRLRGRRGGRGLRLARGPVSRRAAAAAVRLRAPASIRRSARRC